MNRLEITLCMHTIANDADIFRAQLGLQWRRKLTLDQRAICSLFLY